MQFLFMCTECTVLCTYTQQEIYLENVVHLIYLVRSLWLQQLLTFDQNAFEFMDMFIMHGTYALTRFTSK